MDKETGHGIRRKLADELVHHGMEALLQGNFEKSLWALDCAPHLVPDLSSSLWQRGLACFYGGRYDDGVRQFESDMTENGSDVEEVIWHFLCRCKLHGFQKAMADGFLPLTGKPEDPPMLEVLNLFQGKGTVEDVLSAATNPDGSPVLSYNDTSALAYAHFYIGLYHEMRGNTVEAEKNLRSAAEMQNPDRIGKLMRTHYHLFCKTGLQLQAIPSFTIGDEENGYHCTSIISGGWQLSAGHLVDKETPSKTDVVEGLLRAYDVGIRAFDCGDIYTGVEELYGKFITAHCKRGGKPGDILIHTKLVPDLDIIRARKVDGTYVQSVVRRSLNRLGVESLDLVQFHWWDYSCPGYLKAAKALYQLCKEGIVRQIGLTNFDAERTKEFVTAGIPIVSTQVQFSLLDRRPLLSGLASLCEENEIKILAYGVLAGGFLTDKWLGVMEPPDDKTLANRSLVKYRLIIDEFGGWELYQELLQVLRQIADRHSPLTTLSGLQIERVSIAMVAIQCVLSQSQVGGVIIGAHNEGHLQNANAATALQLTEQDLSDTEAVIAKARGPSGPVFGLERDVGGPHGKIMKYNLNQINQGAHLEELCHRFLQFRFQAYPTEATRAGYRFPASKAYQCYCASFCFETLPSKYNTQHCPLIAERACNYDHLPDISEEQEIVEFCKTAAALLQEAEGIDVCSLTPDQRVDHSIIVSQLKLELVNWQKRKIHNCDPNFYLPLNSIMYLLPMWGPEQSLSTLPSLHDRAHPGVAEMAISERLVALLFRLRAIPRLLQNAHKQLSHPVEVFVNTAIGICTSFQSFLAKDVLQLCELLVSLDPACGSSSAYQPILDEIALASKAAAECIGKYKGFLADEILPVASPAVSIGKEVYESILQYSHFIDSSEELLALGETHFKMVKRELEVLAKEIDPNKSWQEITKSVIYPIHSQASNLLSAYMEEIQRAKQHVIANKLVSNLPSGEKVLGFYTPKFLVPFSPFGDFLNPSPFAGSRNGSSDCQELHRIGHLMLHSIEAMQLPKEEEEKLLRAHDYTWISVIAPHETYPGHHVQALLAQNHPRVLRKYYESPLFYEGWGLYTEELAYETGFFEKEKTFIPEGMSERQTVPGLQFAKLTHLTQLRLQLWRAARVILDVKLNRGELSFEECREFLHREVMFNPRSSAAEVYMYVSRPGYAPCYIAGFVLLTKLREQMKQKCSQTGITFSLKEFHDVILSNGCVPFKLLHMLLGL